MELILTKQIINFSADFLSNIIVLSVKKMLNYLKHKWMMSSVSVVVMPRKCGKSEICKRLNGDACLIVDIDSLSRTHLSPQVLTIVQEYETKNETSSLNLVLLPIMKALVEELINNNQGKRIILLTSLIDLVSYLQLKSKYIVLLPTSRFLNELLVQYTDLSLKNIIMSNQQNILLKSVESKTKAYDSYNELLELVIKFTDGKSKRKL